MKKTYIQPLMKEIEMVEASFICSSISTGSGYKTEYNEYVGGFELRLYPYGARKGCS